MIRDPHEFNIGLALSGGGIRAITFHSGVLKYLAEMNLLERVKVISSVSGGSIFTGLVYCLNGGKWPTSEEYLQNVFPEIRDITCNISISKFWTEHLLNPFYWAYLLKRDVILAVALERQWKISGMLKDLPNTPKWLINAAIAKNGDKWVFNREFMGSDAIGYVKSPEFRISEAIAASAAYPGIVGPYQLETSKYIWHEKNPYKYDDCSNKIINPENDIYYFYDGGLFDNLGCDSLFEEFGDKLLDDIDTIVISDACAPLNTDWFFKWRVLARTKKMVDMISSHVDELRLRWIRQFLRNNQKSGTLVKIDMHSSELIEERKSHLFRKHNFMSKEQLKTVMSIKTHLNKITKEEYEATVRNGYETALIKLELYFDLCKG